MFKSKVNRFNDLYIRNKKNNTKSGMSDEMLLWAVREEYVADRKNNATGQQFQYEHVWRVVKDHKKLSGPIKVYGAQPPKRTKIASTDEYTSVGTPSDAHTTAFDLNTDTSLSMEDYGISLDDDVHVYGVDDENVVHVEVEPTQRPTRKDKAKAKAKDKVKRNAKAGSSYQEKKEELLDRLNETLSLEQQAIGDWRIHMTDYLEFKEKKNTLHPDCSHGPGSKGTT
ncbi:hypothetical protein HanHA300_Chr03g0095471 [Helianthus annuus]|nr:hypothetical protein HanHA300_Chr03g0095471 [Helianthus annuus]KAJ0608310.1 hypothetical protein HanHA89_Chr03g0107141 [Helianthus annuus]KAJ0768376.1 hypothetical protein HanLR1_Chr03g0100531 [Helianthus annuus]